MKRAPRLPLPRLPLRLLLAALLLAACGGGGGGGGGDVVFPVSPAIVPFATAGDVAVPARGYARITGTEGGTLEIATNQVLVAMEEDFTPDDLGGVAAWIAARGGRIVGQVPALRLLQAEVPRNADVEEAIGSLPDLAGVFLVVPNLVVTFLRSPVPDPRLTGQGWWIDAVEAPAAWDVTTGDPDAPIGLVDAGMDPTGHFLTNRVAFVTTTDGDQSSHGTATGSLLAADGADGACAVGLAWENPLRVADVFHASRGSVTTLDVLVGTRLVLDSGARIVNLSLGAVLPDGVAGTEENFLRTRRAWREAVTPAVRYAAERDALLFWSAGNSGRGEDVNHRPGQADYFEGTTVYDDDVLLPPSVRDRAAKETLWEEHAVIVAGVSSDLELVDLSIAGAIVALSAPGEDVFLAGPNGSCTTGTGTSFAAPIAAGVAALVAAVDPDLPAPQIRQVLLATARTPTGWNAAKGGAGIVNAKDAVAAAGGGS